MKSKYRIIFFGAWLRKMEIELELTTEEWKALKKLEYALEDGADGNLNMDIRRLT